MLLLWLRLRLALYPVPIFLLRIFRRPLWVLRLRLPFGFCPLLVLRLRLVLSPAARPPTDTRACQHPVLRLPPVLWPLPILCRSFVQRRRRLRLGADRGTEPLLRTRAQVRTRADIGTGVITPTSTGHQRNSQHCAEPRSRPSRPAIGRENQGALIRSP